MRIKILESYTKYTPSPSQVTSLGFQKVAMEMDIAEYKEQVEKLRQELSLEKSKSQKDGNLVLERIAHIKGVLTKQVEEVCEACVNRV